MNELKNIIKILKNEFKSFFFNQNHSLKQAFDQHIYIDTVSNNSLLKLFVKRVCNVFFFQSQGVTSCLV